MTGAVIVTKYSVRWYLK